MDAGESKTVRISLEITVTRNFSTDRRYREYRYTAQLGGLGANGATETEAKAKLQAHLQERLSVTRTAPEFARDDDGAMVAVIPNQVLGGCDTYRVSDHVANVGGYASNEPAAIIAGCHHWDHISPRSGHGARTVTRLGD